MKFKKWRKYLALLLVLTVAFTGLIAIRKMGAVHAEMVYGDGDITITASNLKITKSDGTEAKEGDTVEDGDSISFDLDWVLDNTVTGQATFEIDLSEYLENMVLNDTAEEYPFYDDNNSSRQMGTYRIEGNKLIITLLDEYVDQASERKGWFSATGTVKANQDKVKNGDKTQVGIDNQTVDVIWGDGIGPGKADMNKGVQLSRNEAGKLIATYTITISAPWDSEGTASNLQLTDVPGSGLGNMSGITVDNNGQWLGLGGTYATLNDFNAALKDIELTANQSFTITYTMEITNEDELAAGNNQNNYKNSATLTYDEKEDEPADSVTKEAQITYRAPSVNKGGSVSADNTEVTWTITIDVGSMYDPAHDNLSDYFSNIKDVLGDGHLNAGQGPTDGIQLSDFKSNGNGTFTYTYTEKLNQEYQDSVSKKEVKNHVEVTEKGSNKPIEKDGSVWTNQKDWVNKEWVDYDEDTGTLQWKITIDIPEDAKGLTVKDSIPGWRDGKHETSGHFSIDGNDIIKDGSVVDNNIVSGYTTDAEYNPGVTITFKEDWVKANAGKQIVLLYETKITDTDIIEKTYENYVDVTYTPEDGEPISSPQKTAQWTKKNAVEKNGEAVQGENSIKYTVMVALDEIGDNPELNDVLKVVDTLPEEFTVNASDVKVELWWNNYFSMLPNGQSPDKIDSSSVSGRNLTVSVTVNQTIWDTIEEIKNGNGQPYIKIEYTATMKKDAATEFTKEGTAKKFTNHAEATYNGEDIGEASTETELTPKKVVSKSAEYTPPHIYYTIQVNPDGLDFYNGELTAVDTLSKDSILYYDFESIKVTKADGSELAASEWKWVYEENADGSKSLIFTLPDSMPLTITYRMLIDAVYDRENPENNTKLTQTNSTNEFSLSGYNKDQMRDSHHFNEVTVTPTGGGQAETGSITLSKYYSEKSNRTLLPGAKFAIYETSYDSVNKEMKDGNLFLADIEIDETGQYYISGLRYDQIYVLYETEAPEGYLRNEEAYYFVLTGYSGITLPTDIDINVISSLGGLWYENEIDDGNSGTLTITKSFDGVTPEDIANTDKTGNITFQVTDTGNGRTRNYYLRDFDYDPATGKYTLTLPSPVGMYTVRETVRDLEGYEIAGTEYTIDGTGKKTGTTVTEVEVSKDTEKKIEFVNKYNAVTEEGELVITKTIIGDVTRAEAEAALQFEVTDTGNNTTAVYTLKNFTYNATTKKWTLTLPKPVDTYKITETQMNIKGYTTKSVTYSINGQGQREGTMASVDVEANETTTVDFWDTYEKIVEYGKLVLKKTVVGLTSSDVVATVEFTVTNAQTGVVSFYTLSNDFTFDKATGEWTKVFERQLEVGTYTVTESVKDVNGYEIASTTYTVTTESGAEETGEGETASAPIEKDKTTTVVYTNQYDIVDDTAELVITKTITGPPTRAQREGALVFTIRDMDTNLTRTVSLNEFTFDSATGIYTYKLTRTKGKTYQITETKKDIEGYELISRTYTIDNGTPQDDDTALVELENDITTVAFTDNYQKSPEGELEITKTIEGEVTPEEVAGALKFRVTDTGTNIHTTYTIGDGTSGFKYDESKKLYTLTLTEPVGKYIVEEILTDIEGYQFIGATYTVGGKEEDGKVANPVEVTDGVKTTVAFKNEYEKIITQGDLVITKTIKGPVTPDEAEGALEFKVTDTATGNTTTYTLKDFTRDAETGIYTLTLPGIEAGEYIVEESVSSINGYKRKSVTYSVNGGTETSGTEAAVEVKSEETTTVDFTDEYEEITEFGTLIITKTIEGGVTKEEAEGALEFTVTDSTGISDTYTLRDFDYDEETGIYTLTLETQPAGTYTVTETLYDVDGYRLTSLTYTVGGEEQSGESVEAVVVDQGTTTVDIKDVYEKTKKDGTLVITKTIKGPVTPEEAAGALQFKVTDDKTGISTTYKLSDFTYDAATGIYTLTLSKPAGSYTVEEIITDIYGYVTASVKYSVDGGSQTEGKLATISVTDDKTTTVAFEDTYTKSENGKLIIMKTIKGPATKEEAEGALQFTVTDVASGTTNTYTLKDFSYDEKADQYILSLSKPVGAYTITETVTDIKGYQTASVKYSINGGKQIAGKEATTTVVANQTTTVAYEDKYTKKETGTETDEDTDTGKTPKDKKKTNGGTPKTGDPRRSLGILCIFVAILSGVGIVLVNLPRRKKYKK